LVPADNEPSTAAPFLPPVYGGSKRIKKRPAAAAARHLRSKAPDQGGFCRALPFGDGRKYMTVTNLQGADASPSVLNYIFVTHLGCGTAGADHV
jgi:hypothetical protein